MAKEVESIVLVEVMETLEEHKDTLTSFTFQASTLLNLHILGPSIWSSRVSCSLYMDSRVSCSLEGGGGFVILCAHKKKTTCTQCLQLHPYERQLLCMPLAVYKTLELFLGGGGENPSTTRPLSMNETLDRVPV